MAHTRDSDKVRAPSRGAAMLERLRKGLDNCQVCRWPGAADDDDGALFAFVPVSDDEMQTAEAAARARFEEIGLPVDLLTSDDLHSELNLQVLVRSMRCLDDDRRPTDEPYFASADELRALLYSGELGGERAALVSEYLSFVAGANPEPGDLPDGVLEEIVDLAKKKDAVRLAAFSSYTLATYIIGTVAPPES